ncbi:MAG: hypothetical protein U0531_15560 [Dehalococcoidia bacterium]
MRSYQSGYYDSIAVLPVRGDAWPPYTNGWYRDGGYYRVVQSGTVNLLLPAQPVAADTPQQTLTRSAKPAHLFNRRPALAGGRPIAPARHTAKEIGERQARGGARCPIAIAQSAEPTGEKAMAQAGAPPGARAADER